MSPLPDHDLILMYALHINDSGIVLLAGTMYAEPLPYGETLIIGFLDNISAQRRACEAQRAALRERAILFIPISWRYRQRTGRQIVDTLLE